LVISYFKKNTIHIFVFSLYNFTHYDLCCKGNIFLTYAILSTNQHYTIALRFMGYDLGDLSGVDLSVSDLPLFA